jgi:hypothetical protein
MRRNAHFRTESMHNEAKKGRTVGHFPCGLKIAAWEVFDPIDTPLPQ